MPSTQRAAAQTAAAVISQRRIRFTFLMSDRGGDRVRGWLPYETTPPRVPQGRIRKQEIPRSSPVREILKRSQNPPTANLSRRDGGTETAEKFRAVSVLPSLRERPQRDLTPHVRWP